MSERLRNLLFKDITYYIEKYILSSLMLYYATNNVFLIVSEIDTLTSRENLPGVLPYASLLRYGLLFIFNAFNGSILLCSKRPHQAPKDWKAVVIPLLSSYFMLAYNFTDAMPAWMTVSYAPQHLLSVIFITSCLLTLGGQVISLIAVFYLRRSFGIFIQFRDVIRNGPYKYVRHPMYTGYTLLTIGVLVSNLCVAYALISVMHLGLLAYRARLEETMLAANDPVYKENMKRVGFLFPKLSALMSA